MSEDRFLSQALRYAEGVPLLVVDMDKRAIVPVENASQEAAVIRAWVAEHEPLGMAWRTDEVVVIDVASGAEAKLARLETELGALPLTRQQRTPRGGHHRLFRLPRGANVQPGALADGIEVIAGRDQYVVVDPSPGYAWVRDEDGKVVPRAELPMGWVDALASRDENAPAPSSGPAVTRARGTGGGGAAPATRARKRPIAAAPTEDRPLTKFALSDVGNAQLLVQRHGDDLRYVYPWSSWLVWDGRRWKRDDTGEVDRRFKETCRWAVASANDLGDDSARKRLLTHWQQSERAGRVRAALEMAASEPGIPVLPDQLDRDPWLVAVTNGTIDLRTGALSPHDRACLITKLAPVRYDPDATAPAWQRFLDRVLGGDEELASFVQRAAGYSLTGLTTEQILLILFGLGANGKSTFLRVLLTLLGDYAQQAPAETFLERRNSIPNDVARLRGARLVAATELGEGRRLNEALVKSMTGGDKLPARFLHGEWFEFVPAFTPWLATNHKPEIRGVDEAIWRRIRLVPFTVTIPEGERDKNLGQALEQELSGIFNWALAGCLAWQHDGLGHPQAIVDATAEYRADMDQLGRFLADCCIIQASAKTKASTLYEAYSLWSNANGERNPLSQQALGRRLSERGFQQERRSQSRWWCGIGLLQADEQRDDG